MRSTCLALILTVGCGGGFGEEVTGPMVICHSTNCPATSQIVEALETYPLKDFDEYAVLKVFWYPPTTVFFRDREEHRVVGGYSEDERTIYVRDFRSLLHEATHAHFWRETGDPDDSHAIAPGPWSEAIDVLVNDTSAPFDEAFEADLAN